MIASVNRVELPAASMPIRYTLPACCARARSGAAKRPPAIAAVNRLRPSGWWSGSLPIGSVIGPLWRTLDSPGSLADAEETHSWKVDARVPRILSLRMRPLLDPGFERVG